MRRLLFGLVFVTQVSLAGWLAGWLVLEVWVYKVTPYWMRVGGSVLHVYLYGPLIAYYLKIERLIEELGAPQ